MQREIIPFTTEEAWLANRKQDLTSTDIADLFGCGYSNYEELFHRKLHRTDGVFVPNKRSSWGKALEPCIAQEFARVNGWIIRKKSEYIRIPELRLGSSFDYEITSFNFGTLMEIKNVGVDAWKRDWLQGFEIQAPAKIEIQCQVELLVSGLPELFLCVLVGGNEDRILRRVPNEKVKSAILHKVSEFWRKIDEAK